MSDLASRMVKKSIAELQEILYGHSARYWRDLARTELGKRGICTCIKSERDWHDEGDRISCLTCGRNV